MVRRLKMRDVKELEELLSSYRFLKVEINDLKLRELEEQINLKDEIKKRERKIARIDNAIKSLNHKERLVINERYLEGMGRQSWKLISKSLFLSRTRCYELKVSALNKLNKII